tara:strand:+ start:151 stop:789 length:639 start_codon:yes stop_codon:yes gene_type:complete
MKTVSVILARKGSKGIYNKNLTSINKNYPLIKYTIDASLNSKSSETWVSTNCKHIAEVSELLGAKILWRPDKLSTDTSTSESALLHFAENIAFERLIFIQPTSPLLKFNYIDKGLELMETYDSVFSAYKEKWSAKFDKKGNPINWDINNRPRRQDVDDVYVENGAFYITTKENLLKSKLRYSGNIGIIEMPFSESFQVDDNDDLKLIRKLCK